MTVDEAAALTPDVAEVDAVSVIDAEVSFGSTRALDGVGLDVGAHEIVALVGPSGCGKSTFLRTVAGLVPLDRGTIRLAGTTVDDGRRRLPPEKRRIGLVFQEHSLFPHLSVLDNVMFGIRDSTRRESMQRASDVLDIVELGTHRDRYPHELSGGERQRVTLARALAPRPQLMLFDEPFASIDPNLRAQLRRHVVSVLRTTRTPAVFVTHDQTEALSIGDRVAVMRAGRIEQVEEPAAVFHRPRNRFVAAFMGEASFLPVTRDGDRWHTVLGAFDVESGDEDAGGQDGLAMVRPDDVIFHEDHGGAATVSAVEFRGARWVCAVVLDSGETVVVERSHTEPPSRGTRGWIGLRPGHRQTFVTHES